MKAMFIKIIAGIFALLFLVSAGLQYNDPDPYLWYFIYGMAALISLLYILGKLPFWVAAAAALILGVGVLISWPERFEGVEIGGGDIRNIEEGREALGLLITACVMLIYAVALRPKRQVA